MEDSPVWTLGNITLDPEHPDSDGVLWVLSEETGFFGAPGNTGELSQRLNQHGAVRSPGWKTERTISLSGWAFAPTYATLRRAVNRMTGLLGQPEDPVALTCHSEIGPMSASVHLDGDILTQPVPAANPIMEWSLQVVAPDPRKYATTTRTLRTGLPLINTGDGLDFEAGGGSGFGVMFASRRAYGRGLDFSSPGLTFGYSNETGILQLTNAGTAPSDAVYTLHGPLNWPTLTVVTGSVRYTMTYQDYITPGQRIVIDPAERSVLMGGTASRRHLLNPAQFNGFSVPGNDGVQPGRLAVGLTHDGVSTTEGYVTATVRDAWF